MRKYFSYYWGVVSILCLWSNVLLAQLPLEFISRSTVSDVAIGQSQTLNYTIRNNVQRQGLPIRSIRVINDGDNQSDNIVTTSTTCGSVLPPNATCSITVGLSQPASGTFKRHLSIDYNGRAPLSTPIIFSVSKAKYTVLIYMVGSDLESRHNLGTLNINQMQMAGSSKNLNIILETGGAAKAGWMTVQRKIVLPGSVSLLQDLGSISMALASTIQSFIEWGVTTFPAEKYIIIFWDHGGGPNGGFGVDEVNIPRETPINQLVKAIKGAFNTKAVTFEIIGFDACLLGNTETYAGLYPYTHYFVGSEDLEPGSGWQYNTFLNFINTNPFSNGLAIGTEIVNGYTRQNEEDSTTLSVTSALNLPDLLSAIDVFAANLQPYVTPGSIANWKNIALSRLRAPDYNTSVWDNSSTDVVDLSGFASGVIAQFPGDLSLVNAANGVINAVANAVKYLRNSPNRAESFGLTVYFPSILTEYVTAYPTNTSLNGTQFFSQNYVTMVTDYYNFYSVNSANLVAALNNLAFAAGEYTVDVTNDYDQLFAAVGNDTCTNVFDNNGNNLPALPCVRTLQSPETPGTAGSVSFNKAVNSNNWPLLNTTPVLFIPADANPDTPGDDVFIIPVTRVPDNHPGYLNLIINSQNQYEVIGFQDKTGSLNSEGKLLPVDDGEEFYTRTYANDGGTWSLLRTDQVITAPFQLMFGALPATADFNAFRFLVGDLTGALTITTDSEPY